MQPPFLGLVLHLFLAGSHSLRDYHFWQRRGPTTLSLFPPILSWDGFVVYVNGYDG